MIDNPAMIAIVISALRFVERLLSFKVFIIVPIAEGQLDLLSELPAFAFVTDPPSPRCRSVQ